MFGAVAVVYLHGVVDTLDDLAPTGAQCLVRRLTGESVTAALPALIVRVTLVNMTAEPLSYHPGSLMIGVGQSRLHLAAKLASGQVPSCGSEAIVLAIVGGHKGTPSGISIKNEFAVTFDRVGKAPSSRCVTQQPSRTKATPARSPMRSLPSAAASRDECEPSPEPP